MNPLILLFMATDHRRTDTSLFQTHPKNTYVKQHALYKEQHQMQSNLAVRTGHLNTHRHTLTYGGSSSRWRRLRYRQSEHHYDPHKYVLSAVTREKCHIHKTLTRFCMRHHKASSSSSSVTTSRTEFEITSLTQTRLPRNSKHKD